MTLLPVVQVVRLMRMIKPIRIILETLMMCLPQLVNIIVLLFLVYSMFAVVGVSTFGTTRQGQRLGHTASFEDWGKVQSPLVDLFPHEPGYAFLHCSIHAWRFLSNDSRFGGSRQCS